MRRRDKSTSGKPPIDDDRDAFYDDVELILNVSEDQLKNDEGFDNKNWPNLVDDTYRKQLDTQYNVGG